MSNRAPAGRPRGTRSYIFNGDLAMRTRILKGLTQREVSQRCEELGGCTVDDSNIAKYERGNACPGPKALKALAAALELNVADLIVFREAEGIPA